MRELLLKTKPLLLWNCVAAEHESGFHPGELVYVYVVKQGGWVVKCEILIPCFFSGKKNLSVICPRLAAMIRLLLNFTLISISCKL